MTLARNRAPGAAPLALMLALAGCGPAPAPPPPATPTAPAVADHATPEAIRHLNLGIAYLEQHRFGQARSEFQAALDLFPGYVEARVDLAIALAAEVEYAKAEAELKRALEESRAPNPTALYMLGLIHRYKGEKDAAAAAFEQVLAIDPEDTDTKYNLATVYKDRHQFDQAIPLLEEVLEASPHFVSALYALGQAYLRQGQETGDPARKEKGLEYIRRFEKLSGGATAETAGLRYGEQGHYSMALEDPSARAPGPSAPIRFVESASERGIDFIHDARGGAQKLLGSGVLVLDLDLDGDEDVLLVGASEGRSARLYRNDGQGRFTEDRSPALAAGAAATGVAAGDVDGDKRPDLLIAGHLLRNCGESWADVTTWSGLGPARLVRAASLSFVDLDHDGDLDLAATFPDRGGVRAWSNDGAGRFTPLARTGMEGAYRAISLTFTDFDNDRDIDALMGVDGEPSRLYSNNRDLTFTDLGPQAGLAGRGPTRGVAAADLDGDGYPELLVTNAGERGSVLYRNARSRKLVEAQWLDARSRATGCVFLDADLDGDLDLVLGEETGLRFFRNDGRGSLDDETAAVGLDAVRCDARGLAAGDLDGDGDPDLVANVLGGQALLFLNQGAEASAWIQVAPRGLNSNKTALGTKVEVRAASLHQKLEVVGAQGYLSQGSQTLTFGLDGEARVDRVRLLWPGGVLQAETDLAPRKLHAIEELDRKGSSCPFLWAWDGSELRFVSDIQGGSPLGLWVAPGVRNLPDPDEWLLLPDGLARPRDGAYDLRISDSLEEIAYLDRVRLRVVDAPAGVLVIPNERLLLAPPFAPYGLHFLRETRRLERARDGDGREVREALAEIDRRFAGALRRTRLRGFAEPWSLELDFGQLSPAERSQPWVLFAHGWVEFSNSTPIYAAAQAGLRLALPALDLLDGAGRVFRSLPDAGAPAGLPKWMAIDLTGLLPPDGRVRLVYRTNMEVYFDQVLLGRADPSTPHRVTDLEAAEATLGWTGYPERWSPDGRPPYLYRYRMGEPLGHETWTSQEGFYTRPGDVRELVAAEDDRLVVMSHGDDLQLRFPSASLAALEPGAARHLILYSVGYAKDLDLRSAAPLQVGPLPFRRMAAYPYDGMGPLADPGTLEALARFNTRHVRPDAASILR